MKKHAQLLSVALTILSLPSIGIAAAGDDVFSLTFFIFTLLRRVGMLFMALAVMFFIWGVVKFIANAADTAEHAKGKEFILWGIIAFVVLVSLWGIVGVVLSGTFGITPGGTAPYINKSGSTL